MKQKERKLTRFEQEFIYEESKARIEQVYNKEEILEVLNEFRFIGVEVKNENL